MLNKMNIFGLLTLSKNVKTVLLSVFIAGLTGCTTSVAPNYYTLAPRVVPTQETRVRVIEILPVNLPDRLDRSSIMINTEQGQSTILDNDRWTSNLSVELHDSLSSGLQQQLGAVDRYSSGISNTTSTVYRIAIDFSRFDIIKSAALQKNGDVEVEVSWMIKPIEPQLNTTMKQPTHQTLSCRMTFNQEIASTLTVPDMVTASKIALNRITTGISNTVLSVEKGNTQVSNAVCS